MLIALSHPHNPLLALPRLLQAAESHRRQIDLSVDTLLGVPFVLVQHAWRFEWLVFHSPSPSYHVSTSAGACKRPRTAHFGSHYPIANERLSAACTTPTPRPTLADPEVLGLL